MSAEWLDVPVLGEGIMASVQSSFLQYRMITHDLDAALARKAKEPLISRQVTQFKESASRYASSDEMLNDFGIYSFAIAANGLGDMDYAKGLMRKVINEGSGSDGYASKLTDTRYMDLAESFQVKTSGEAKSLFAISQDKTIEAYKDIMLKSPRLGEKQVDANIQAYQREIASVRTVDDLVGSQMTLTFSMQAYKLDGLLSQGSDALRKGLLGDTSDLEFSSDAQKETFAFYAKMFSFDADGNASSGAAFIERQYETIAAYKEVMSVVGRRSEEQVTEDVAAFQKAVGDINTVDDFMKSWGTLTFGLRAFDLEGLIGQDKELRKALIGEANNLNFRNSDEKEKFAEFLKVFSFDKKGSAVKGSIFVDPDATVNNYIRQSLEADIGEEDVNVRLALYFQRKAPDIKNIYDVLGDEALIKVVQGALGLAPEMSGADVDVQARALQSRINIEDFKDPEKVERLIQRFLILADDGSSSTASDPILMLMSGEGADDGLGYDLLMTMQSVKR